MTASLGTYPAFPVPVAIGPMGDSVPAFPGMSMREYYAAHAPAVPDWFSVDYAEPAPIRISEDSKNKTFDELHLIHMKQDIEIAIWHQGYNQARFWAWRWHYADQMVLTSKEGA